MKNYIFFILFLFFSVSAFSQKSKSLQFFISSLDSTEIHGATVLLDGKTVPFDTLKQINQIRNFPFKEGDTHKLVIKHDKYETINRSLTYNDVMDCEFSYKAFVVLHRKNDDLFISGDQPIPFRKQPDKIREILKGDIDSAEFRGFLSSNGMKMVSNDGGFILIMKKNGKNFSETGCNELKELRNSGYIIDGGPAYSEGFFSNVITVAFKDDDEENVMKIMKKYGFTISGREPYFGDKLTRYVFKSDDGLGLGITEISKELIAYPEIKEVGIKSNHPVIYD